jgi:hypothetical protein
MEYRSVADVDQCRCKGFLKMKRPRTPSPKETIRDRATNKPLYFRYAELLHLRKAVEDAEARVRRGLSAPRNSPVAGSGRH